MTNPNDAVVEALRDLADGMSEWAYAVMVSEALELPEEYDQYITAALADHGVAVVRTVVERLARLGAFERNESLHREAVEAMKRLSEFADLRDNESEKGPSRAGGDVR